LSTNKFIFIQVRDHFEQCVWIYHRIESGGRVTLTTKIK